MVCVFCCESYDDPSAFRTHMNVEHQTFSLRTAFAHCSEGYIKADCSDIRCRICFQQCENLEEVAVHLRKAHLKPLDLTEPLGIQPFKPDKLKCAICQSKFFSLRQLSRHTQTHFLRFTCEACGKSYATNTALQVHIKYSHLIKEHYCRKCKTKFSSLEAKRNHLHESTRCWSYLCNMCGERFLSWNNKQLHMKEAHGVAEESHVCPECGKVFTEKSACRNHFKIVHTDDNYVCTFCGLKFATKKYFEEHRIIHTNEKPFQCTVCSKSFSRKKNLNQHLWIHSENKRFECKLCNKKFNQRVSWKSHNKTNHPDLLNLEHDNNASVKFLMSVLKK